MLRAAVSASDAPVASLSASGGGAGAAAGALSALGGDGAGAVWGRIAVPLGSAEGVAGAESSVELCVAARAISSDAAGVAEAFGGSEVGSDAGASATGRDGSFGPNQSEPSATAAMTAMSPKVSIKPKRREPAGAGAAAAETPTGCALSGSAAVALRRGASVSAERKSSEPCRPAIVAPPTRPKAGTFEGFGGATPATFTRCAGALAAPVSARNSGRAGNAPSAGSGGISGTGAARRKRSANFVPVAFGAAWDVEA